MGLRPCFRSPSSPGKGSYEILLYACLALGILYSTKQSHPDCPHGLPFRLKKREWDKILGKRKTLGIKTKKSKTFSTEQGITNKGSAMDLYLQEAERAVEKNWTCGAIQALRKLRGQPIGVSLRKLRMAVRVTHRLRRFLGHPNASVVRAAKACLSRWGERMDSIREGVVDSKTDDNDNETASACNHDEVEKLQVGFAHTEGFQNYSVGGFDFTRNQTASELFDAVQSCFVHTEVPPDGQIWEYALHVEYYLFQLMGPSYEYRVKVMNLCKVLRDVELGVRELIRQASLTPVELCHMNVEKNFEEADDLMGSYERRKRKEQIAALREQAERQDMEIFWNNNATG